MRQPEKVVLSNMCMVSDGKGNVLVQRRVKGWNGLVFPGGHVELHETISNSVIREIKEETGLEISNIKICGVKQWFNDAEGRNICFCFKTSSYKGELKSSDEGEIFWMKLEELQNSKEVAFNFDRMLKVFLSDDINEMFCFDDYINDGDILL